MVASLKYGPDHLRLSARGLDWQTRTPQEASIKRKEGFLNSIFNQDRVCLDLCLKFMYPSFRQIHTNQLGCSRGTNPCRIHGIVYIWGAILKK